MHHNVNESANRDRDSPPAQEKVAIPPIPVRLAHRPTLGGLVVPFITPRTYDGRYLFGGVDPRRQRQCLIRRLCSVCGDALLARPVDRLVLLMRLSDLPFRRTSEPALDPVCAAYTQAACPMVAGQLSNYRSVPMRLGVGMAPAADQAARLGATAEPWFAVWLPRYDTVIEPRNGQPAASYAGIRPLRIRPITWRHVVPW
ncbi:hypothetical protein [Virgisporangium aurantiacum]|uniref:Uncharacterized protein n=1 Tax=Virgisporangium aurantiacum TaxID=175570 RepID=A0A8J3ZKA8_9ACTN|nr:hypothetical protein [Virgisporangium aurantiacum]GIJ64368.1 hypothetical protein Vau01_118840 [Virgisporangium aurantiacum]